MLMNRSTSFIFSKKIHSHKIKSKFSRWTHFHQHKLCLEEVHPHHLGEFHPFCLPSLLGLMQKKKQIIKSNIQRGGRKFLGHFIRHSRSQILSETSKQGHTKRINPKFATESEFKHICVLQYAYAASDIRSTSSF